MQIELLIGLTSFALITTVSPGPNNLMLMSSGANFGFKRTLPHMFGIGVGFAFMVLLVGMGLMQVFELFPQSYHVLKVASISYLFYLAYKIATAGPLASTSSTAKPLTFLQAAAFQWLNPKAWSMALSALSIYAPSTNIAAIALVAAIFALVNMPSTSLWTLLGQQMQRYLTSSQRLVWFNRVMATILVASVMPVII